ncbi:uncharacterized protein (TIGR00290 family) [Scopulibacillus darangshiensis]|uniref:Uncharacterized protein (TIGR00290 family) n=1 Tax=Scopulibacillus darangshiensis TaxID=442528 RepID=A0A4R2NKL6_9BACL|nr:diphthine--ammonia ligase [Scopulibacillus darangshiensis]TCP22133.1 uncharacterized protein (TIGR00290 family) [Scopulibacillus darangshiensis]
MEKKIALSWSGGKDGCLALDTLVKKGYDVACLVTTVPEETGRTFGHGEKVEMITLQSQALAIPVHFITCTFEGYTESFVSTIKSLKEQYHLSGIAFGDLYLDGHREWGEKVADASGLKPLYPLWMTEEDSADALKTFTNSGYKAVVIRVMEDALDDSWLGRPLDQSFVQDILGLPVCPMGEHGEYHTFVYNGPLFHQKIELTSESIITLETTKRLEFSGYNLVGK